MAARKQKEEKLKQGYQRQNLEEMKDNLVPRNSTKNQNIFNEQEWPEELQDWRECRKNVQYDFI